MNKKAEEALRNIGVENVSGSDLMGALDFQTRKLVEIAKVVMKDPQVLVIDETSTALSHDGRELMYQIIYRFRDEGKAVIFISHDLDEIMDVCDTLTVLRDGQMIRTFTKEEFDADAIRTSMIGRELEGDYYRSDFTTSRMDEVALKVENVSVNGEIEHISFDLHKGEILGVGGLSHCGMHTLGKVLFGARRPDAGKVVTAKETEITSAPVAMKNSIGYVSKDRDVESLNLSASIRDNIAIAGLDRFAVGKLFILDSKEKKYVQEQIDNLSIKCSGMNQQTSALSGGNKQ